jgi:hypothetical protein
MLIAVSGSQGAGKSTILEKLSKDCGFKVIERKTSRSILAEWGVSLDQVNNDPDLTLKFQDEIMFRKYRDERLASVNPLEIVFTERTFADLFTYAVVSIGKDNNHSYWLNRYYDACIGNQQIYDYVFYLRAGHFTPVADGVRGANHHYSRMVDLTMLDFTKQMTLPQRINVIETPDLEQRVAIIRAHVRTLLNQRKHTGE